MSYFQNERRVHEHSRVVFSYYVAYAIHSWMKYCSDFLGKNCFLQEPHTFIPTMESNPHTYKHLLHHHRYIFFLQSATKGTDSANSKNFLLKHSQFSLTSRPLPDTCRWLFPVLRHVVQIFLQTQHSAWWVFCSLRKYPCYTLVLSPYLLSSKFMLCGKTWHEVSW